LLNSPLGLTIYLQTISHFIFKLFLVHPSDFHWESKENSRLVSSTFLGEVFQPILEGKTVAGPEKNSYLVDGNQKSGEKTSGGYIEVGS